MAPLKLKLDPVYAGDTWEGFQLSDVNIKGALPTIDLASCKIQFKSNTGELGYEMRTDPSVCHGEITITDAVIWAVTVHPVIFPMQEGIWKWDMEMTDVAGNVITLLTGRLRIVPGITT